MKLLRRLPPTAFPISTAELRRGFSRDPAAPARFSAALARELDVPACYLADSGRTALYLLLKGLAAAAGPKRNEVLLPAYTCPALARVALDLDLKPIFADVAPDTFSFAPGELAGRLSGRTLVVIHVHLFGVPTPLDESLELAQRAGAWVIEDAAQAMGARIDSRPVGTIGDFGLFSLGPGKPLSTGGGGLVSANRAGLERQLATFWSILPGAGVPGAGASAWALLRLALLNLAFRPAGWWLSTTLGLHRVGNHEASWGYRLRGLTLAQAAVGEALLPRLAAANNRRRANARRLMSGLADVSGLQWPQLAAGSEPIYLRLPVLARDEAQRENLHRQLWAAGIGAGRLYRQTLAEQFPEAAGDSSYPGAEAIAGRLLTLPTHAYLTSDDCQRIIDICRRVAG